MLKYDLRRKATEKRNDLRLIRSWEQLNFTNEKPPYKHSVVNSSTTNAHDHCTTVWLERVQEMHGDRTITSKSVVWQLNRE